MNELTDELQIALQKLQETEKKLEDVMNSDKNSEARESWLWSIYSFFYFFLQVIFFIFFWRRERSNNSVSM